MKNFLKQLWANNVVERAAKTFVQAFVASLLVTGIQFTKATLTAALAAGASAAWNYFKTQ